MEVNGFIFFSLQSLCWSEKKKKGTLTSNFQKVPQATLTYSGHARSPNVQPQNPFIALRNTSDGGLPPPNHPQDSLIVIT